MLPITSTLKLQSESRCFGGIQAFYSHFSATCQTEMRFAVYLPPQAQTETVPILYFLSGLTCTEENFVIKAGAQQFAAQHGILLVVPDTSPRNTEIPGEDAAWDLGSGAGFYVDATAEPWRSHYQMYSYVVHELPNLIKANFPVQPDRESVFGHSMGGHGALICALKNPGRYRSVSALAPIASAMRSQLGQKALSHYLGPDQLHWRDYDASELVRTQQLDGEILIDQGTVDQFLDDLMPQIFEQACAQVGQKLNLRRQEGYDHGYYFVASFMADHMRHHAKALKS